MDHLKKLIREVPNWPKPGILFYDITTLLKDPAGLRELVDALTAHFTAQCSGCPVDLVLGVEARGFIFAPAVAYRMGAGFVPVRKPGKLPAATTQVTYSLEYGAGILEIHRDAIQPGQRVLIVDDLLATGGTAAACVELVRKSGGTVAGVGFAVELVFLNGRKKLEGQDVFALLKYEN